MAKAPTKRKTRTPAAGGSRALASAKAQVARLEQAEKKRTAIASAEKGLTAAKAALAKAKAGK